jgi:hypothetical protein
MEGAAGRLPPSDVYRGATHSVGTFRGTSSKKPVRGTCRMVLRFVDGFAMRHVPRTGFLRTFHETSLHCG